MQYHQLKRNTKRIRHVQVGRGGKRGKTSGRGHKGQKARAGHKIRPEIRDMIKRIPKLRGRGVNINTPTRDPRKTVSIGAIDNFFKDGDRVTPQSIFDKGLIRKNKGKLPKVKVVANGQLKKKLSFRNCLFSRPAKEAVESAGGEIK